MTSSSDLADLINLEACPIEDDFFIARTRKALDEHGAVCLNDFLTSEALSEMIRTAEDNKHLAFYTSGTHNVYLTPVDDRWPEDHIYNRQITSSKGCITTDQIPPSSGLHQIYRHSAFTHFIASVVGEAAIYPYADPLSGINIHYASEGQELGWHFDNSSFAVTLLLQAPEGGGVFEYCRDVRNADKGEMNFECVDNVVSGRTSPDILSINPGTLVLFRGRNSLHRVTPTEGRKTRYLVVLAYNHQPGISLSENARMTFYGRLGA